MKNSLENFIIPGTFPERQGKLDQVFKQLKQEFVGLDNILEDIKKSISLWYITPELMVRPTVVSLWGMTGTGKTTVVNRLTELLGLRGRTLTFDCAAAEDDSLSSTNIVQSIEELIGDKERESESIVLVFDEFQLARTITEMKEEINKPRLRPIWGLLDSGVITNTSGLHYEVTELIGFIEDLEGHISGLKTNYSIQSGKLSNLTYIKSLLLDLGLVYYEDSYEQYKDKLNLLHVDYSRPTFIPSNALESSVLSKKSKKEKSNTKDEPIILISPYKLRTISKYVNKKVSGLGTEYVNKLYNSTTIFEFVGYLTEVRSILSTPTKLDCSKSLVFVLGNLDEAFTDADDYSPDLDADGLHELTELITVSEIKSCLGKRFRPEQVARFGNNILKYPTLTKEGFYEIIRREVNRLSSDFTDKFKTKVNIGEGIIELLYKEGVYPTQGVRPVLTTVGQVLTPILSEILQSTRSNDNPEVSVELENIIDLTEKGLNLDKVTIKVSGNCLTPIDYNQTLTLGALRDPKKRKARYCIAVHEAGHAIALMICNRIYPKTLVAVSTDGGGFCSSFDKIRDIEIPSKFDIQSGVKISLAGYLAEKRVFTDESMHLLGSSSDLTHAWELLSDSAYNCGYFNTPIKYADKKVQELRYNVADGMSDECGDLSKQLMNEFTRLTEETAKMLEVEKELLKAIAIKLGQQGKLSQEELKEIVASGVGNIITEDYMKGTEETYDYYLEELSRL